MRRRLRRRPAPPTAPTPKSTYGKPPGHQLGGFTFSFCVRLGCVAQFRLRTESGIRPRSCRAGWVGTLYPSSAPAGAPAAPGRSALSLLRCGERPGGHPDVASGGYSYPGCPRCATWCARRGGVVRSDIRVPEAKRGRVPCRNEDEHRPSL